MCQKMLCVHVCILVVHDMHPVLKQLVTFVGFLLDH